MSHKFRVGEVVRLERYLFRTMSPQDYEVRLLVPPHDSDPKDHCYRIKSAAEKYERAAVESELTLSPGAG